MIKFKELIAEENKKVKSLLVNEANNKKPVKKNVTGKWGMISFEGPKECAQSLRKNLKSFGITNNIKMVDDNYIIKTNKVKTLFDWSDNDECLDAIEHIVKAHKLFSYGLYEGEDDFDGGSYENVLIATTKDALQDGLVEMREYFGIEDDDEEEEDY